MKSIEQEWEGFSEMIFAKMKPSPVQIEETKRAFFAGYWGCLCSMKRLGEPDISEDDGVKFMEAREAEGKEFYRELIKRYSEGN